MDQRRSCSGDVPPGLDDERAVRALDRFRGLGLVPLFPITSFVPGSACPHHGPIRPGSSLCCMVCDTSGLDHHPALQRDPATDPKPERKPDRKPQTRKTRRKTRDLGRA